jgi:hypothetical protein
MTSMILALWMPEPLEIRMVWKWRWIMRNEIPRGWQKFL